jgi:predicted DsbA family dithiol-disulfide isomerase
MPVSASKPIQIEIWSDYICPFCYVELPVVEEIRAEFKERVSISWRAFELRPEPTPMFDPQSDYIQRGWKLAILPLAAERGLTQIQFPKFTPRSRKAHEAAKYAESKFMFHEFHDKIFRAHFELGLDIENDAVILDVAAAVGLDKAELQQALANKSFLPAVQEDQATASELGIDAVPAFMIHGADQGFLISGAQPFQLVREAILDAIKSFARI